MSHDPLYFCGVCCNFSFFISNFIDLSPLPLKKKEYVLKLFSSPSNQLSDKLQKMSGAQMLSMLELRLLEIRSFAEFPGALVLLFKIWAPKKKGNITTFLLC